MFFCVFLVTKPPVNFELLLQGPHMVFAPDKQSRQPALHHVGGAHGQEDVRPRAAYMGVRLGSGWETLLHGGFFYSFLSHDLMTLHNMAGEQRQKGGQLGR